MPLTGLFLACGLRAVQAGLQPAGHFVRPQFKKSG
jgi:hypothetical protein